MEKVIACLESLRSLSPESKSHLQEIIKDNLEPKDETKTPVALCVLDGEDLRIIFFKDIDYCEADNNYCNIYHTSTKKPYNARATLKEILSILPEKDFHRIHDSYIVAERMFVKFNRHRTRLYIQTDKWLPISRRYREHLLELFRLTR